MSIRALTKSYPYSTKNDYNNMSFKEKRVLNEKILKDQYNYYLTRYINAYDQYLMYKSPYYGNNRNKALKLRPIVLQLNNKLIELANSINNDIKDGNQILQQKYNEIYKQNKNITLNYKNQKVLNDVIMEKSDILISQDHKIKDTKENIQSININKNILFSILAISIIILIGLLFKINRE